MNGSATARLRVAVSTVALMVAGLVIVGCSSGSSTPQSNSTTPITLTLATFNKFGYTDALLAQYHALHPNVTVVQNIAATSNAAQKNPMT